LQSILPVTENHCVWDWCTTSIRFFKTGLPRYFLHTPAYTCCSQSRD